MAKEGNGIFNMFNGSKKEEELPPGDNAPNPDTGTEQGSAAAAQGSDSKATKQADLEATVAQLKDQLLRKAAEFENYKRRVENDTINRIMYANERLIGELLPVVDDFERSLKMSKSHKDFETFFSGVEMIYQKLLKVLGTQGLKPFDSVGQPFNTDRHNALMQMAKADVPPHTVIEEVERGYTLNDRVIRHAKVIVSSDDGVPDAGKDSSTPQTDA